MKKPIVIAILIVVSLGLIAFGATKLLSPQASTPSSESSPQTPNFADAVVLDVRTAQEFAETHAKQAINLPLADIEAGKAPEAGKTAKIIVYCRSGNRSAQAAALLKEAGYSNVEDLGGIEQARSAGLEFTN